LANEVVELRVAHGFAFLDLPAELVERDVLDLAEAFAGHAELLADPTKVRSGPPSRPKR
jgi:hypothetical protein